MRSPADAAWYHDAPSRIPSQGTAIRITPALDTETKALMGRLSMAVSRPTARRASFARSIQLQPEERCPASVARTIRQPVPNAS